MDKYGKLNYNERLFIEARLGVGYDEFYEWVSKKCTPTEKENIISDIKNQLFKNDVDFECKHSFDYVKTAMKNDDFKKYNYGENSPINWNADYNNTAFIMRKIYELEERSGKKFEELVDEYNKIEDDLSKKIADKIEYFEEKKENANKSKESDNPYSKVAEKILELRKEHNESTKNDTDNAAIEAKFNLKPLLDELNKIDDEKEYEGHKVSVNDYPPSRILIELDKGGFFSKCKDDKYGKSSKERIHNILDEYLPSVTKKLDDEYEMERRIAKKVKNELYEKIAAKLGELFLANDKASKGLI